MCLKWHKEIIGNSDNTIKEANKLSKIILQDSRIKALAENPLLLTTLLFVKRWAGYLPTKRSVLYQEMIKLLLVTWNVEGHEILDIEEAEPQLAFVAYWMTQNGQQTISAEELNNCLVNARKQMPEILGYTNINPSEFIKRVESRSSLLIMSGHKRLESGFLSVIYEFLHLSFQEYLTAKAIVKGYIPRSDTGNIIDIIKPNINNENWKEVIPLVAVLLERDVKELIEFLISETKQIALDKKRNAIHTECLAPNLLGNCLANEIQVNPELLAIAIEWYAKNAYFVHDKHATEIILKNKFGNIFRNKTKELFFIEYDDKYIFELGSTLADVFNFDFSNSGSYISILEKIVSELEEESKERKCIAILGTMDFIFNYTIRKELNHIESLCLKKIFDSMYCLLNTNDPHFLFAISWCIAWAGERNIFPDSQLEKYLPILSKIWSSRNEKSLLRATSWAISKIITPDFPKEYLINNVPDIRESTKRKYNNPENEFDKITAVYLGTILGEEYNKEELKELFNIKRIRPSNKSKMLFAKKLHINISEKPFIE